MPRLFARQDATPCRSCGAVEAPPPSQTTRGLCYTCGQKYLKWCRTTLAKPSDNQMNSWLARQLFLDVKRLEKFGVSGRCEAVTKGNGSIYMMQACAMGGYQCGRPASGMRYGRRVCPAHSRAESIQFVNTASRNIYEDFTRLMTDLAATDDAFLKCLKDAIAAAGRR